MATRLIANVEIGRFPSYSTVTLKPRWTLEQEADMNAAIANGQWQKASWFESEHSFMLPQHHVSDTYVDGILQLRCLSLLTDLRVIQTFMYR